MHDGLHAAGARSCKREPAPSQSVCDNNAVQGIILDHVLDIDGLSCIVNDGAILRTTACE